MAAARLDRLDLYRPLADASDRINHEGERPYIAGFAEAKPKTDVCYVVDGAHGCKFVSEGKLTLPAAKWLCQCW